MEDSITAQLTPPACLLNEKAPRRGAWVIPACIPNARHQADQLQYYRELVRAFQARPEATKALVDELGRVVANLEGAVTAS